MSLSLAPSCPSPLALVPVNQIGGHCRGYLRATYVQVLAVLGPDNATHLDDDQKVSASWGFADQAGRHGYVWAFECKRGNLGAFTTWSIDGDEALLEELFPDQLEY